MAINGLVNSIMHSSLVSGASAPYRLTMAIGAATLGRLLSVPVVAIFNKGKYLIYPNNDNVPKEQPVREANITPVTVSRMIGGGIATSCALPLVIAVTPFSAVGGVIFGLYVKVTGDGRKQLVGLAAVPQEHQHELAIDHGLPQEQGVPHAQPVMPDEEPEPPKDGGGVPPVAVNQQKADQVRLAPRRELKFHGIKNR